MFAMHYAHCMLFLLILFIYLHIIRITLATIDMRATSEYAKRKVKKIERRQYHECPPNDFRGQNVRTCEIFSFSLFGANVSMCDVAEWVLCQCICKMHVNVWCLAHYHIHTSFLFVLRLSNLLFYSNSIHMHRPLYVCLHILPTIHRFIFIHMLTLTHIAYLILYTSTTTTAAAGSQLRAHSGRVNFVSFSFPFIVCGSSSLVLAVVCAFVNLFFPSNN